MFRLYEKINAGVPYFIAEMSANHGGSLENALAIVRAAAAAGADCVKLQTYTADTITIDCDRPEFLIHGGLWDGYKLHDLYADAFTPWEWQGRIKQECEACGVDFLSTPFDPTAVDFLEKLGSEAYKIASFELVDTPLIEYAARLGKPMILSCGMAAPEEIADAVAACRRAGNDQIVLLKCCSEYPAPWDDMNLASIPEMAARFGVPVGLSDHSAGALGAVVGAALGAVVIEKHVCLPGIASADSGFSMPMDDFAAMVRDAKIAARIKGRPTYARTPGEQSQTHFRRSLYAVRPIAAGEAFTPENVRSIRPDNGLAPKYYPEILGKTAARDIARGEPLSFEMINLEE